jgi:hypothetical protein
LHSNALILSRLHLASSASTICSFRFALLRASRPTDFFRRTSERDLYERFLPIVKDATARAGVTAAYKRMTDNPLAGLAAQAVLGRESVDLDAYVTTARSMGCS